MNYLELKSFRLNQYMILIEFVIRCNNDINLFTRDYYQRNNGHMIDGQKSVWVGKCVIYLFEHLVW